MGKKPRTEKQLANDQRLRDKAKLKAELTAKVADPTAQPEEVKTVTVPEDVLKQLMEKVQELENNQTGRPSTEDQLRATAQMQNATISGAGVQGRMVKYPIEKSYYPDPTERLYDEPLLKRYNLRDNFYFTWDVEGVEYEKYGVTYAEPRFIVHLYRRIFGEDGITPNGQVALINRQIMHEDEVVARRAADKLGITDSFETQRDMLDEMRFYRIRQWLLELFSPVKVESHNRQATQMVIDGKVVEVYDTEAIIDGDSGREKASTIESQVRI